MAKISRLIENVYLAFLNLIYPKKCQGCGELLDFKHNLYLCETCLKDININKPPFCIKCGVPISGPVDIKAACGRCINTKYTFDEAFYCCDYKGLIRELIHKFKYNHKRFLLPLFENIITKFMNNNINTKDIDMVVPVPLHRGRLQQRGFDQSLLLSNIISRVYGLPVIYNVLRRGKDTKQQTSLNKKLRLKNINGAFFIRQNDIFKRKNVLLIDDVFTTASTANECARVLKLAGAKQVLLLALARGA